jgi:hypothetical protein
MLSSGVAEPEIYRSLCGKRAAEFARGRSASRFSALPDTDVCGTGYLCASRSQLSLATRNPNPVVSSSVAERHKPDGGNVLGVDRLQDHNPCITPKGHVSRTALIGTHMYSYTDTPAYGRSGSFVVQRSSRSEAAPWSNGAKVLLLISLISASWAAVILAGYFIWSAL